MEFRSCSPSCEIRPFVQISTKVLSKGEHMLKSKMRKSLGALFFRRWRHFSFSASAGGDTASALAKTHLPECPCHLLRSIQSAACDTTPDCGDNPVSRVFPVQSLPAGD